MIERQQIIEKSADLFTAYGIRTNTMEDIAREFGISKKTLYQFVSDKNELIELVIDFEHQKVKTTLEAIKSISENSIDELIRINAMLINFLKKINPAAVSDLRKLYQPIYEKTKTNFQELIASAILNSINKGKRESIFRDDINEVLITKIHTDRIDQMQESSGFWGSESRSPEVIKEMITYYLRGLVTEKGEKLLNQYILDFNKYLNE